MLFESNVFNMIDWTANGVEPCTGMYLCTIPIASLPSNLLQGPPLELALRFNQFNAADYGFGIGWELNLTRVDTDNGVRTLVLSGGQRYRILAEQDGAVNLQYKNTRLFTCTTSGPGSYTITYKNGNVERLVDDRIRTLTGPNRKSIHFNWNADQSFSIQDEEQVTAGTGSMVTTCWQAQDHVVTTPRSAIAYTTGLSPSPANGRALHRVTLLDGATPQDLYRLRYIVHNTRYLCLADKTCCLDNYQHETVEFRKIDAPPGMPGDIYAARSLHFDTSGTQSGESFATITYARSEANYTGYPAVAGWMPGTDNLESLPDTFTFTTADTSGELRTVLRTYNRFYLLCSEQPMLPDAPPGSPAKEIRYGYALTPGGNLDAQSPSFMLPTAITTVFRDYDPVRQKPGTRSFSTFFRYDDFANLLENVHADSTTERYTYYPAEGLTVEGDMLCPPDPGGFINYIQAKTLYPRTGNREDARQYDYEYIAVPDSDLVQISKEIFATRPVDATTPRSEWTEKIYEYQMESGSEFHGSLIKATAEMLGSPVSGPRWITTRLTTQTRAGKTIRTETRLQGFDDSITRPVSCTTVAINDIATGDLVESTDENGLVSTFVYDRLGRREEMRFPWGTDPDDMATLKTSRDPLESAETMADSRESFLRTEKFNSRGDPTETCYLLTETEPGPPHTPRCYLMARQRYNLLGQLEERMEYDYDREKTITLRSATRYQWNIFDEPLLHANPDKSISTYTYYPVYDNSNSAIITRQQPGNTIITSIYNNAGILIKRKTVSGKKSIESDTEEFIHDGYWRVKTHTRATGETLNYEYDVFDRTIRQTGKSSGDRHISYAPHTDSALETVISIDGVEMGRRTHDGLSREIVSQTGRTIILSDYTGSALLTRPARVWTSGGRHFAYEYCASLAQITRRTITPAPTTETPAPLPAGIRTCAYQKPGGRLSSLFNSPGNHTDQFSHDAFGNPEKEYGDYGLPNLKFRQPYENTIRSTIRGRPLKVTARLTGKTGQITLEKHYVYQEADSMLVMEEHRINNMLRIQVRYERSEDGNLGRTETFSSVDVAPALSNNTFAKMSCHYTYGMHNMITRKIYTLSGTKQPLSDHKMTYFPNGLLAKMQIISGETNQVKWEENYRYEKGGTLKSWRQKGNVSFNDPFNHHISAQDFTKSTTNNILAIHTEHSIGRFRSRYEYIDNITLKKIFHQPHDKNGDYGVATTVTYETDTEGNITEESTATPTRNFSVRSTFSGETNFSKRSQWRLYPAVMLKEVEYYYDGADRILTIMDTTSATQETTARYYIENDMIAECAYGTVNGAITTQYFRIYHRCGTETLAITMVSADMTMSTHPCINLYNGSQIAIGEYSTTQPPSQASAAKTPYYYFHHHGLNAYGYVFNAKSCACRLRTLFQYRNGSMVPSTRIPAAPD